MILHPHDKKARVAWAEEPRHRLPGLRWSCRSRRSNLSVSRKKSIAWIVDDVPKRGSSAIWTTKQTAFFFPVAFSFSPTFILCADTCPFFPSGKNQFDGIRDTQDPGRTFFTFFKGQPRKGSSRESGRNSCCTSFSTHEDLRRERGENDEQQRRV